MDIEWTEKDTSGYIAGDYCNQTTLSTKIPGACITIISTDFEPWQLQIDLGTQFFPPWVWSLTDPNKERAIKEAEIIIRSHFNTLYKKSSKAVKFLKG